MNYAIFRIGKKHKSIQEIQAFERHTERKQETLNANTEIKNTVIVGSMNVAEDVKRYIKDVKLRKNNVIARDLLMAASPQFMEEATEEIKERWIEKNKEWLQQEFGENLIYLSAHNDEKTLHLHALIVPKFYDEKRNKYILANKRYWDGAKVLSEWQDRYSKAMEEFNLQRGTKWSKSTHTNIKVFYNLINKEIDKDDLEVLVSKAKNSELLKMQINKINKTLKSYQGFNNKTQEEKEEIKENNKMLLEQVQEIEKDKEIYKECIKTMSKLYNISQTSIKQVIKYVADQTKEKEKSESSELEK